MLRPARGKIARLPPALRAELNARLLDGWPGASLLAWLNALPAVRAVLADDFDSRPLNRQNLLAWKRGAYADWLRRREACALLRHLHHSSAAAPADPNPRPAHPDHASPPPANPAPADPDLSALLQGPLTLALGSWFHDAFSTDPADPARRDSVLALAAEVTRLRQGDHRQRRLSFEIERWRAGLSPENPTAYRPKSNRVQAM